MSVFLRLKYFILKFANKIDEIILKSSQNPRKIGLFKKKKKFCKKLEKVVDSIFFVWYYL